MNSTVLIANAIALVASFMMVGVGLIRDKRRILLVQSVQFVLGGTSNLLLGGVSGCISNFIGIARNLCCVKRGMSLALKIIFSVAQAALTLLFSRGGALELVPIVATCIYTFALDTKNPVFLKSVMVVAQVMWLVYDFAVRNYVASAFDVFTTCSLLISIAALKGMIKPRAHRTKAA